VSLSAASAGAGASFIFGMLIGQARVSNACPTFVCSNNRLMAQQLVKLQRSNVGCVCQHSLPAFGVAAAVMLRPPHVSTRPCSHVGGVIDRLLQYICTHKDMLCTQERACGHMVTRLGGPNLSICLCADAALQTYLASAAAGLARCNGRYRVASGGGAPFSALPPAQGPDGPPGEHPAFFDGKVVGAAGSRHLHPGVQVLLESGFRTLGPGPRP
jgi:hypothetical protein